MLQRKLLALFTILVMALAPVAAQARGGGGGGAGGFGAGRPFGAGRFDTTRAETRAIARALQHRDSVGRPNNQRARAAALDRDASGRPVVRGEIIAVMPDAAVFEAARQLNLTVRRQDDLAALGLTSATLQAPDGMTAAEALAALRRAVPGGTFDYAHIYDPSGEAGTGGAYGVLPADRRHAKQVTVGMIDGGIATRHRALRRARIEMRSFAAGRKTLPTVHGTAVASLLVGQDGSFAGYLPGATLLAADVFGGAADGGSAVEIARALNWLAEREVPVSNISLAGPPNALLAAAVKAFLAKGHVLVAAAGNDGPAALPNYPASYPGVVAVTSVDSERRIAFDANRVQSGFAAPGVAVRAANLPEGYTAFSGTSYATPAVAAGFALLLPRPGAAEAKAACETMMQSSQRITDADTLFLIAPSALVHSAATQ